MNVLVFWNWITEPNSCDCSVYRSKVNLHETPGTCTKKASWAEMNWFPQRAWITGWRDPRKRSLKGQITFSMKTTNVFPVLSKRHRGLLTRSLLVVYERDPYKLILCVTVHGSEQPKFIANYISTFKWWWNTGSESNTFRVVWMPTRTHSATLVPQ